MADGRLRELERRWKETGSVEDEARYLQARVRAGEPVDLELAAALGYAPARRAIELLEYEEARDLPLERRVEAVTRTPSGDPITFLEDLVGYGKETLVRASVAAIQFSTHGVPDANEALWYAIEAWVVTPTAEAAAAVRALRPDQPEHPLSQTYYLAQAIDQPDAHNALGLCRTAIELYRPAFEDWETIGAIQAEVLPWALGTGDPVRMRIAKQPGTSLSSVSDVRKIYKVNTNTGPILGCTVEFGELRLGARAQIVRRGAVVWEGTVTSLRIVREAVDSVPAGSECGVMLTPAEANCVEGDSLETYDG